MSEKRATVRKSQIHFDEEPPPKRASEMRSAFRLSRWNVQLPVEELKQGTAADRLAQNIITVCVWGDGILLSRGREVGKVMGAHCLLLFLHEK